MDSIASAKLDYSVKRLTLVKIAGGGSGSDTEKRQLEEEATMRGLNSFLDNTVGCLFHTGLCFFTFGAIISHFLFCMETAGMERDEDEDELCQIVNFCPHTLRPKTILPL
jgi:hypothetical protein